MLAACALKKRFGEFFCQRNHFLIVVKWMVLSWSYVGTGRSLYGERVGGVGDPEVRWWMGLGALP